MSTTDQSSRIVVFDTTLRDGAQAHGAAMEPWQKVEIATALAQMGVDVIEAGFPASSSAQFEAVRAVAQGVREPVICALARATDTDIQAAAAALEGAAHGRIHTFIGTSPLHREYKLRMNRGDILEAIRHSVRHACQYTADVQWSAEDATRTEPDFLVQCVEAAIAAGAQTINIPDTVGYTDPMEYAALLQSVLTAKGAAEVVFSVHCHDDLGMAVANSLAGLKAGARQVECTVNGIGERAGNAALEEVVMALRVRQTLYGMITGIMTPMLCDLSRLVAAHSGYTVQRHKAIVGNNAFAHASGIHQDGMIKHRGTYEIMQPEDVGNTSQLCLDRNSGRKGVAARMAQLGYTLSVAQLDDFMMRFNQWADTQRVVNDRDLIQILNEAAFA